jgi:hypothetical protein
LISINPKLEKYIATRDRKIHTKRGYQIGQPLLEAFSTLLEKGEVLVGGRASCGGATDPTWVELTLWNEVVSKAKTLGYSIRVESIKQKNAYATIAGGFWHENKYLLEVK